MTASMEEPERAETSRRLTYLFGHHPEMKSLEWREKNVRMFNSLLEGACTETGVRFQDVNEELLDRNGMSLNVILKSH